MKLTGMSRESADILGDVVGTNEYNAVPAAAPSEVDDGNFSEDSIATEDGDGAAVEGEPTENVIEDQDDLDLTNKEGGEYDSSEASTEDGDAVDTAFDAIGGGTDDISTDTAGGDDGSTGDDTASTDDTDDVELPADGDDVGGAEDTGDTADTSVGGADDISVDTGAAATDDTDTTATDDTPADPAPAASDVPVETVDTDQSGLDASQVKEGAEAVESFFQVLDRRAARSFEDGAASILDEPEVADADIPVPADDGSDTTDVPAEGDTGDGADIGGDTTSVATDEPAVEEEVEVADLGATGTESFFNIF